MLGSIPSFITIAIASFSIAIKIAIIESVTAAAFKAIIIMSFGSSNDWCLQMVKNYFVINYFKMHQNSKFDFRFTSQDLNQIHFVK